jgi:hypothetical protein
MVANTTPMVPTIVRQGTSLHVELFGLGDSGASLPSRAVGERSPGKYRPS